MAKRKPEAKLSWTPRKRENGKIYCSPACGADCTYEAYLKAEAAAKRLATTMGKGWTPRVWENLGWHWEVISKSGRVTISPTLGRPARYVANIRNRWCRVGRTPKLALKLAFGELQQDLKELAAAAKESADAIA